MPSSANPAHEQQRRYARSKLPQADYQTATDMTQAANRIDFPVKDANFTKWVPKFETNKGDATGHNHPTERYVTENEAEVSHDIRVCSEEAGRDLLDAFGSVAVTTPDAVNAPGARKHKFTPLDIAVSKQLPARTFVEVDGPLNRAFPSMVTESYELKGSGSGHVSASASYRGSGKRVTPSGISASDIARLAGLHYFTNSMVKLARSDSGTLLNPQTLGAANRLDEWAFRVKNNLLAEQGYVPGAELFQTAGDPKTGMIRSELLVESQEFEFDYTARFAAQSEELAHIEAGKEIDILLALTGPVIGGAIKHKLAVNAPRVVYEMVDLQPKDKVVQVQIKCLLMFDLTLEYPASAELTNTILSYTA